jgi:hypothetical protein
MAVKPSWSFVHPASAADVVEGFVVGERWKFLEFPGGIDGGENLFLAPGGELAAFAGFLHHLVGQAIPAGGRDDFVVIDATGFQNGIQGLRAHGHIFGVGLGGFFWGIGHGWNEMAEVEVAAIGEGHKPVMGGRRTDLACQEERMRSRGSAAGSFGEEIFYRWAGFISWP